MTSLCCFSSQSPDGWWCWASLHRSVGHLYVPFAEVFFHVLCLLFQSDFFFLLLLLLSYITLLYILDQPLIVYLICEYIPPLNQLHFFKKMKIILTVQKLIVWRSPICLFFFCFSCLRGKPKKVLLRLMSDSLPFMFSFFTFEKFIFLHCHLV